MSEAISKAKLLEWLETESKDTTYASHVRDTITTVLLRIKRGTFDLPTDVDVKEIEWKRDLPKSIREIERIEHCLKELIYLDRRDTAEAVKAFRLLMEENKDLRGVLAEKEAEVEKQYAIGFGLEAKLNQALEALKKLHRALKSDHDFAHEEKDWDTCDLLEEHIDAVSKAIQQIRGEDKHVEATTD